MKKLLLILTLFLLTKVGISQNEKSKASIDKLVKGIDSDRSLTRKVEEGKFVGYISKENDTTWVPFKTVYFFKENRLVKVVSTDYRIHDTNTRTIVYFRKDNLIKIEQGIVFGQSDELYGIKAYFVKDTSIYSDIEHTTYRRKQSSDSSDVSTARYYQSKANDFIDKNERTRSNR